MLVKIVQNDFRHFTAFKFDYQAHAVFIGLVANIRNAFDFLFVDEFGDTLLQGLFVDLIGQRVDNNRLAIGGKIFEVRFGTHDDSATARAITFAHANDAIDNATCRKVWCGDELDQLINCALRVAQTI